jgi:non-canonical (house-cleaning) NTP pyrophosphatase
MTLVTDCHRVFALITVIILMLLAPACGNSQDLNRSNAKRLIEEAAKFKAPVAVELEVENERHVQPKSADESEQNATERAMEMYLADNRQIAVLRQLGYVDVKATVVKRAEVKGSGLFASIRPWIFKMEPFLTEKGKAGRKNQDGNSDKAVVLARREVVEVTGIRKAESQAVADFTWKAVPTEIGKVFDPASDSFKSLPPEMQETLKESRGIGPFGTAGTVDWSQTYKAAANFQKYDNGWRLTSISSGSF